MNTTEPTMSNLFEQLGLDASDQAIARFIQTHQLAADVALADAPFWSVGQRQFLTEQLKEDALWAEIVDQLNKALHADAVRAANG
ncbi:MAG: DUF2789 family protein [Acidovorax sp.]